MVGSYMLPAEFSSNPVKRALQRRYWRLPFKNVDRVLVNSIVMKERLQDYLEVRIEIEVIPNDVDTRRFRPVADLEEQRESRRLVGLDDDACIIVTVGSVDPRKGTDLILAAWAELATKNENLHLVVVGPREDIARPSLREFRAKLQALVESSEARERVHFVGNVNNVEEFLRAADMFVFASQREGVPAAVLEAMSTGLPVVTTRFLGLPDEFGTPEKHFLLVDRNSDHLCQAISKVLRDKQLSKQLGRSARRWVDSQLDLESTVDQLAHIYRQVAEHSSWLPSSRPLVDSLN